MINKVLEIDISEWFSLTTCTNTNYVSDKTDRKLTSSHIFKLEKFPIQEGTKKQP